MSSSSLQISNQSTEILLNFLGEFTIYNINSYDKQIELIDINNKDIIIDLSKVNFLDSGASIYLYNLQKKLDNNKINYKLICNNKDILDILTLVKTQKEKTNQQNLQDTQKKSIIKNIGISVYKNYLEFLYFISFVGELFATKLRYLSSFKSIRYKEIFFEINESGVRAFGIISLTSFLIGVVVAYQSAFQLKIYGANIFIVDMLGISILRELAPLITAIVIAGRSGSAFTAQIGAMKITQELDAMKTMGFDPYMFLVLPRIIALMITLPILIFIADIMGILGGMLVANLDLGIGTNLFLDRFNEVISAKHFFVGLIKGPFFAFLIASIGIYRGMMVKDDTQSIGFNTTRSVVESIFAVIVCDALFSIAFTNLGI